MPRSRRCRQLLLHIFINLIFVLNSFSVSADSRTIRRDKDVSTGNRVEGHGAQAIDRFAEGLVHAVLKDRHGLAIYVSSIIHSEFKYACPFSEHLTGRVRHHISASPENILISPQAVASSLSNLRSLKRRAKSLTNLDTSDAHFVEADAVLAGAFSATPDQVRVTLFLNDLTGKHLSKVRQSIDRSDLDLNVENPVASRLSTIAGVAGERNGGMVDISTNKGGRYQRFHAGERIRFDIRVAKPLYIYLYNINAKGEVERLFPYGDEERSPFLPNRNYTFPSEEEDWEIIVEPPFGQEMVKLIASETRIPPPVLDPERPRATPDDRRRSIRRRRKKGGGIERSGIHPHDFVHYHRSFAHDQDSPVYEDSLFIRTDGG